MGNANTSDVEIRLNTTGAETARAGVSGVADELKNLRQTAQQTKEATEQMASSMEMIKKIAEAWGLFEIVKEVGAAFGEANAEANRLVTSLISVTGSIEAAKQAYEEAHTVLRSSGEQAQETTEAYMRLANVGIKPSAELLKSLAGVAIATNKDISTAAGAFAMSAEGHSRGLAQLGIAAKDYGDKVLVSFQGQSQLIDKSKQGIQEYIESIGQTPAAIEAMNAKLNTSAGAWDQLKKSAGDLFETIGGGGSGKTGWFTQLEQGATSYIDKLNAIIQRYGILRASAVLASGSPAEFEALAAAAKAANEELAKLPPLADRVGGAFNDMFARILPFTNNAKDMIGGVHSLLDQFATIPTELAKQQAETAKADEATKKWTETMVQHAATMGIGAAAMARYRTTVGDLKDANDSVKMSAVQAGQAEDARTAALKARSTWMQQDKSDWDYIERLKMAGDAEGHTTEYSKYLEVQLRSQSAATKEAKDAMLQLADANYKNALAKDEAALLSKLQNSAEKGAQQEDTQLQSLIKHYDELTGRLSPLQKATNDYKDAVDTVNKMLREHLISIDEADEALNKITKRYDDASTGAAQYREAEHQLRLQLANDLSRQFSDFLVDGFQDGSKKLLDLQKNLAKQIMDFWIKEKIIIPMEQQMKGGGGGAAGAGWSSNDTMMGIGMAGQVAGNAIGGKAGGALAGAASGFMIGNAIFPGVGGIVGAVMGGLAGLFGSSGDKSPSYSIYGGGGSPGQSQGNFSDYLGTFGMRSWHSTPDTSAQVKQAITQFDNQLAALLSSSQLDKVRSSVAANREIHYDGSNPEDVLKAHLDAAITAVMPQFQRFIDGLSSVQDRLAAFQGLQKLQEDLKNFQSVITQISGNDVAKLTDQIAQLDKGVADAQDKLTSAIKMGDPTQIVTAEQALRQSIVDRYQQEMQMLAQVRQAIAQLEASSYSLNLSIEQKMAAISGDFSGVIGVARSRMNELTSQIMGSTDPAEQMGLLNDFTGALDTWLSSSTQAINDALNAQLAQLEAQKQTINDSLTSQLQGIADQRTAEQARIQAANQAASASAQAANAGMQSARQAQTDALQKQVSLAQQWLAVLDRAASAIQSLQTGNTNPLGPYAQFAALESTIAARIDAVRNESGDNQVKDATQLIADLQQRLQLIQSGELYQRSSPEYLEQYNKTLRQLAEVQGLAGPKASQIDLLQAQLDAIRSVGVSIGVATITTSDKLDELNKQEADAKAAAQAHLDAIAKREEELKAEAKAQLDKLNQEALSYYSWARTTAQAAEQKRHDELVAQLKAITGGLDPDSFIAQETKREVDLLTSIDDSLKKYLNSISNGSAGNGGTGGGNAGGGGGGGGGSRNPINMNSVGTPIEVNIITTVNGTGMGSQDIADAVNSGLRDALPSAVPALKRMLKVA
ncbi:MAG: hypothetical protein IJI03_12350 [Rudaea sp.]|nr:hypothetical protein [Rudaea sp.]